METEDLKMLREHSKKIAENIRHRKLMKWMPVIILPASALYWTILYLIAN